MENEDTNAKEKDFQKIVEKSIYYDSFSNKIDSITVLTSSETEEGIRYTIDYVLVEDETGTESHLVFVGDEEINIIESVKIELLENGIFIDDLMKKYKINYYLPNSIKGPVGYCYTYTCDSWSYSPSYINNAGCSQLVGQACNAISTGGLINSTIKTLLCKAGVWIACNVSIDKYCTHYDEYEYFCEL